MSFEDEERCLTPNLKIFYNLIPIILQSSLVYPGLNPDLQPILRFLRLILLPINLYICLSLPFRYCWRPFDEASGSNLVISTISILTAFRSIEWALVNTPYHTHPQAWPDPLSTHPQLSTSDQTHLKTQPASTPQSPFRFSDWFAWSILCLTSLRGTHFTWGLRRSKPWNQIQTPSLYQSLKRLTIVHLLFVPSVAYSLLDRDHGVGWWAGENLLLQIASTLIANITFGITILGSMETYYTLFSILARLAYVLPIESKFWKAYWSPQAFTPTLFSNPHLARSMAQFWGQAWHAMFRWPFLISGMSLVKPLAWIGILKGPSKRIAILFATFICSGIYHEYAIWAIAHSVSHPNPYNPLSKPSRNLHFWIRTPFTYFLLQPMAILLESVFLPYLPNYLHTFWVYVFTLSTVTGFRQQFFGLGRMISGPKSVETWGLSELLIPGYLLSQL